MLKTLACRVLRVGPSKVRPVTRLTGEDLLFPCESALGTELLIHGMFFLEQGS